MKRTATTTKTLIVVAGLCSAVCFAQGGGSGGGGAGAGGGAGSAGSAGSASGGAPGASASAGTASSSSASGATGSATLDSGGNRARASGTAPGSVISTSPTGAPLYTPNMNTVTPSQGVADPAGLPTVERADTSTSPRVAAPSDASPLSGISKSEIPVTSSAPPPIAADGSLKPTPAPGSAEPKKIEPIIPAGAESLPADRKMTRSALGSSKAGDASMGPAPAVKVTSAPPAAMRESTPTTANDGQVWVPGHYTWNGDRWNWSFGSWERPPTPGATWIPGNYDAASQRWTPGYWNSGAGAPTGR